MGAAFNWGWKKFTENIGVILIAALLFWLVVGALNGVGYLMAMGIDSLAGASVVRRGTMYGCAVSGWTPPGHIR